jgi:histidine triad (HIT) family protein
MSKPCPFCAIAGGEAAEVVYGDAASVGFLDRSPLAIGHVLLIPRVHVETIFQADAATLCALAVAAKAVARALKRAFAADGLFVAQNNVVSQSVPHLHVHLVPRFAGDRLFSGGSMVWRRVRYRDEAQRAETAERIRAALAP